jgi:hypothetical protein
MMEQTLRETVLQRFSLGCAPVPWWRLPVRIRMQTGGHLGRVADYSSLASKSASHDASVATHNEIKDLRPYF